MKLFILLLIVSIVGCAGVSMNPSHVGHYTFRGKVFDENKRPIPHARIKVLSWETETGSDGSWRFEKIVECGATGSDMNGFTQKEVVLVTSDGFISVEHPFDIERAAWFQKCPREENEYVFDTILRKKGSVERDGSSGHSDSHPSEIKKNDTKSGVAL